MVVVSSPLAVEARTFQRRVVVAVEHRDDADALVASAELRVRAAPLVLNHHVQPAERIWAVVTGANGEMIEAIESAAGARFSPIYSMDPWIQDELEWASATRDGHRLDVAVDSIRDRELDGWVKALEAPDVQPMTWGAAGTATTEDKFGNLETAPPHVAGGVSYPFGRVYYGANEEVGPTVALTDMLGEQRIQAPIAIDTGWLCVGHVDELLAFVPDPSAARGFKLLYADVDAAYALLESMSASTSLPRYGSAHGYATVGEILADAALRALNEDVQSDYLDPIRDSLLGDLGLEAGDLVRVPALFERVSGCPYSSSFMETTALIPALVNLTVYNPEGEAAVLFVPDPFLRASGADQATDPFVQAFRASMPAGTEVVFVDDWYSYHLLMGDVHCGTNVSRTPSPRPWVEGLDLLGGA
jgi:protein-arginine deiminase